MTRREYTPADLATLALPGSLPGLLAPSWRGPVLAWREPARWVPATIVSDDGDEREVVDEMQYGEHVALSGLRLPLARPEARARVACWLAEGGGTGPTPRPPVDARWMLDWPGLPGSLPAWVGASVLHVSALRVAAGMGAVRAVLAPFDEHEFGLYRRDVLVGERMLPGISARDQHSRREADARDLSFGYALLDGDVLTMELP